MLPINITVLNFKFDPTIIFNNLSVYVTQIIYKRSDFLIIKNLVRLSSS